MNKFNTPIHFCVTPLLLSSLLVMFIYQKYFGMSVISSYICLVAPSITLSGFPCSYVHIWQGDRKQTYTQNFSDKYRLAMYQSLSRPGQNKKTTLVGHKVKVYRCTFKSTKLFWSLRLYDSDEVSHYWNPSRQRLTFVIHCFNIFPLCIIIRPSSHCSAMYLISNCSTLDMYLADDDR